MIDQVLSTALSGLNAQQKRLSATASNVANVLTSGARPGSAEAAAGAPTVYKPLQVDLSTQVLPDGQGAGVSANITEKQDGYSVTYSPDAAGADADGLVAVPNVDLTTEMVNLLETKTLYKANAAVIRTADEMQKDMLDVLA